MEGGMFYEDRAESGTLRLKIITLNAPKDLASGSRRRRDLSGRTTKSKKQENEQGTLTSRKDGNALFKYEEAILNGAGISTIFYWIIANPLPPHHGCIVTFSYTVIS